MKTTIALISLMLAATACVYYPDDREDYPYPPPPPPGPVQSMGSYRAVGTEPFWALDIGRDMVFSEAGNDARVIQPTPPVRTGFAGEMYDTRRIRVNIVHSQCSDGMSDRTYPDRVQVWVDGRQYEGCGAPTSYFSSLDERGDPIAPLPAGPAPDLSQTNWRVVAINGRPVPQNNYYLNFMPDRIGAKFGCNNIGADYRQDGDMLNVGMAMATRMACPDMSFEDAGMKILAEPMIISSPGDRVTLSNSNGSIELVRAN